MIDAAGPHDPRCRLPLLHTQPCDIYIPGPYLNEDGDWWVAVEDASYKEARAHIVGCLPYDIPFDGTLLYKGREMTTLCTNEEHEVGPDCDASCHRRVLAWHFVENRRW